MPRYVVKNPSPGQISGMLEQDRARRREAIGRGVRRAGERGRLLMVRRTSEKGKVHRGDFKNAWRVRPRADGGVDLVNDAPYAGVIELGARPHRVSAAGVDAIREWVRLKVMGVSATEAAENSEVDQITWGIVARIERYGQPGTFLVRDAIPELRDILGKEIARSMRQAAKGPSGG